MPHDLEKSEMGGPFCTDWEIAARESGRGDF